MSFSEKKNYISNQTYRTAVMTLSDKGAKGERKDESGPLIIKLLEDVEEDSYQVVCSVLDRKSVV